MPSPVEITVDELRDVYVRAMQALAVDYGEQPWNVAERVLTCRIHPAWQHQYDELFHRNLAAGNQAWAAFVERLKVERRFDESLTDRIVLVVALDEGIDTREFKLKGGDDAHRD